MLVFNPSDPFPLLPEESHSYAEAQAHAARVDDWLGLRVEETESVIPPVPGRQIWAGLSPQALQTPYTEIRLLLERLQPRPGQTIVDLGAGYGRIGLVLERHFPDVAFIGLELSEERVIEGRRVLKGPRSELRHADLAAVEPPEADAYFLYDFGTRRDIQKALEDLKSIAGRRPITVVGRGRASRDAIERGQPWLAQVVEPRHFAHYSIYRSR